MGRGWAAVADRHGGRASSRGAGADDPGANTSTVALCLGTCGDPTRVGVSYDRGTYLPGSRKVDSRLSGKWEIKLPWRKAGLLKSSR